LANAIAPDAVNKGVYELSRGIDVILRNPKKGQEIKEEKDKIIVEIELDGVKNVEIYGRLPTAENYREFLVTATKDIRVARRTAAYAAALVASKLSDIKRGGG
jgi:CRISPR type I-A-associated protein Csa5